MIGKPEQAEQSNQAYAPVQMYGRVKETKKPFNLLGPIMLEAYKGSWVIIDSDLTPRGVVKE